MGWWKDFVDGLFSFLERLGSEKTFKAVEGILRIVLIGADIYQKFNRKLTGEEKAAAVRNLVNLGYYATEGELQELFATMMNLKESGDLEKMEPWELDKIVGDGLSLYVAGKKKNKKEEEKDESGLKKNY